MRALGVDDRGAPVHKSGPIHGRAVSYAGGLGVSDVQASGMPMPTPTPRTGPAVRAVSSLHHQRSDTSIAQTYAYGQPNDYGVYYPVTGRESYINQYPYGTPAGDPSVFGSPVTSSAAHRMSYGYSNHNSFYPDASQGPSSYYYTQGLVYPSPQMGHAAIPAAMHSPVPGMTRPKRDLQVCGSQLGFHSKFQSHSSFAHREHTLAHIVLLHSLRINSVCSSQRCRQERHQSGSLQTPSPNMQFPTKCLGSARD